MNLRPITNAFCSISFSSFYPNPFFLLKALPPWLSVPRFLAEIKLICIMKVGPIHCAEVKKGTKEKENNFHQSASRVWATRLRQRWKRETIKCNYPASTNPSFPDGEKYPDRQFAFFHMTRLLRLIQSHGEMYDTPHLLITHVSKKRKSRHSPRTNINSQHVFAN